MSRTISGTSEISSPGTPHAQGFCMPAEWSPHAATWLAWPHNPGDWPRRFKPIAWVYADIIRQLSREEDVHVLVNDAEAEKRARRVLGRASVPTTRVHFHRWPTNRVWTRDSGPIFIHKGRTRKGKIRKGEAHTDVSGEVAVTNWKFNAWAKYNDWQLDDQLPSRVAESLSCREWTPSFNGCRVVLEGGSIDTNGAGVLLTTEECLLSEVQQRNPGMSRADLERVFHDYLGIERVIWLNRGIAGDDTHGHVDDIARFAAENVVVAATESHTADENHLPLAENLDRLKSTRNLDGEPFRVVELPMPAPVVFEGQRLPASYANFYIANGVVLVPTFNDPNDRHALNTLAEVFPGRRIVGIHCGDFIWGLGALHCMTQQQPL